MARIYLSAPDVGPLERDYLLRAFDEGWIAPVGPDLDGCEADIRALTGWPGAVALASGTAALHLALLDVVMPDMDGHEVCRRMHADAACRDIPVIFVTAHNDEHAETLGLEAGAVDFISKPINPAIVRARVKTHLTLKAQADLLRQWVYLDGLTGVSNRRGFDVDRLGLL